MTDLNAADADWRREALKALKGQPLESLTRIDADGLPVKPLYTAADAGPPLYAPRSTDAEGRAWDLRVACVGDDSASVNDTVLADLAGGAASLILGGAVLDDPEPLARALAGVALELAPVGLDAGLRGPDAANALAVVAKGSPRARLLFHLDPLSAFAETGRAFRPIAEHLSLAANTAARHAAAYPEARLFLASGRVVHEAGGSGGQELGFAAAAALTYAKAGVAAGLPLEVVLARMTLGVAVDAEYLDAVAKARALRLIWSSLAVACGVRTPAIIEARSSRRMLAATDPWSNLPRLAAAGFAGAVGGADAIVLDGFSQARGEPDAFARRQARNTQLVLMEEAHLGRVDDPAAGSWFLDARTRQLAEAGWAVFQRIESQGGLVAALVDGAFQREVADARRARQASVTDGGAHMVGVNRFVDPNPRAVHVAARPEPGLEVTTRDCEPLTPVRWAEPIEARA